MVDRVLRIVKKFIPRSIFVRLQPLYHYLLALAGALIYRFPSKDLYVIAVTGTKGKSSVVELINAILEAAGHQTAVVSTIRFKAGEATRPNLYKMTLPGRFFLQRFLREAKNAGSTHAVVEMTSEAVVQFRHKFIALDVLVFTNLSPEHIESHGSFENYKKAKLKLRDALITSSKRHKLVVANIDDEHGKDFLNVPDTIMQKGYSIRDAQVKSQSPSISLVYNNETYTSPLQGTFNVYNILAAICVGEYLKIAPVTIQKGLTSLSVISGRVEHIDKGQPFDVIVDYAHTPDSLEKLYKTFENKRMICVLGNTGGGRDTWKRPRMGNIAEQYCDTVILTDEDPYDEDPGNIVKEMQRNMKKEPTIIMNRREAIAHALKEATKGDVVLITGKGTDPYIMRAGGKREPWSDKRVTEEEIETLLSQNA